MRFKFNLFIQYKATEEVRGVNAREWSEWGHPYFRFAITHHQQSVLETIDRNARERAIAVYCAPTFLTQAELWDYASAGILLAHSHFVRAELLSSHHAYTYIDARTIGKACSISEDVAPVDMNTLLSGEGADFGESVTIEAAARMALTTIKQAIEGHPLAAVFVRQVQATLPDIGDRSSMWTDFVQIYLFEKIFGIQVSFVPE
jgi:hypothetical protein